MGFYIKFHPKVKTTNNGSFLKLFKTLTARISSSFSKFSDYPLEFLNLIKTLLFMF